MGSGNQRTGRIDEVFPGLFEAAALYLADPVGGDEDRAGHRQRVPERFLGLAGAAKNAFVSVDLSGLRAGLLDSGTGLVFEPVLPAAAADLLHRGLEAAAQLWPAGLIDDDMEDMRPFLAHRVGKLRAVKAQPAEASWLTKTAVGRRRRHSPKAAVAGDQVPLFTT